MVSEHQPSLRSYSVPTWFQLDDVAQARQMPGVCEVEERKIVQKICRRGPMWHHLQDFYQSNPRRNGDLA